MPTTRQGSWCRSQGEYTEASRLLTEVLWLWRRAHLHDQAARRHVDRVRACVALAAACPPSGPCARGTDVRSGQVESQCETSGLAHTQAAPRATLVGQIL